MATKEWLNSHAKVTAYLDFSLYASLENWMKKNKIKKVSQALTIILEHYLEGNIPTEVLPETLEQEVKELKVKTTEIDSLEATVAEEHSEIQAEINELKEQIDELRQALINAGLSSLKEKVEDIPKEKIKFSTSQYEASEGLTKEELCKKINLNSSKINQWASLLNLSPEEYLYQLTGWRKPTKERRYFPSSDKGSSDGGSQSTQPTKT